MKAIPLINSIILLSCTIACANKNPGEIATGNNVKDTAVTASVTVTDTFETGKVISPVFCKADAAQSYAIYIPVKGNREPLPVVYFFDPHADGSFPLAKYKALADTYDFILIGSNNSKNGNDWSTTESTWSILFDDSQKRLKINTKRIYTCGFSGGAKVAGQVALTHNEVKGVIANGAGLPDETPAGNFNFSFTAIAGEGDMNMTDLVAISTDLDKTQTRHRIIFFDGKHEWAPENTMNIAFTGLQLDAIYEKLAPQDEAFINSYITGSKKRMAVYLKTNNYIKAEAECKLSISLLDGLTNDVTWFKEKESSIKSNDVYQKQWQAKQNLLVTEQNLKAMYMQQFQQGDMNYWVKMISDLQTKAKVQTAEGAMYQRLLAYLSLAFYSISNQLITGHRDKDAQYFVALYKMADATNSEAWYFSALLNARNNNAKAAEDDLLKAVTNGFTDKNRMMQQPEFQNPGLPINFTAIESKMKKRE
jgi:ketosteroid isomerase-like protein